MARRKLNKYVFYGSTLKVEYSPESENEDDIRMKIQDRIQSVLKRLDSLEEINNSKKGKPSLMNFYNQPITLKSTLNSNIKKITPVKQSQNANIYMNGNNKKRIHLLSNTHYNNRNNNNNNNNSNSSHNKRQRRRI
ncbi:hypothetical protein PIROE2DRAFT_3026 [Piromyces sp. E2]|nr:hypothetical protein PIROE2DRAFT_3026 [Piromyces sp. E2]|eukprot:OUM69129.1 hypothetical protein PIROE2DRAFT_3026 [Piromyces sp. E2]